MKRINERAWEVFGVYGRVCESCSGAIALSLLQALAMFGCLEKREAGGLTLYCILTFIAVVANFGCQTRMQVAVDDILKDFEAVDFFHGEHPGVMYSHRKLLIRKSELLTRHTGLRTIAWTFL